MNNTLNTSSTKCATCSIIEEGILKISMIENAEIDLEESKLLHKISIEVMKGKKFVALIDARVKVVVSKEAREWGSSPEAQGYMLAQAILVHSLANKIIGNFIIQFHKPVAKTKLFFDEPSAIEWLREQKSLLIGT